MKIVRISAIWCSSCILMKSRFNEAIKNKNVLIEDLNYDTDDISKYNIGEILPVYIKIEGDKEKERMIGEHSKSEVERFIDVV